MSVLRGRSRAMRAKRLRSVGNRPLRTIFEAVFEKWHYVALWNMYRSYPAFTENLRRYLTGRGEYPYVAEVRTPKGRVRPTLYSHHDLLTLNEIFCRHDYSADETVEVVVDLGSNIGLSALYFMTRSDKARCYLFEPDPRNAEKLKRNLAGLESRYRLREEAVSDISGQVKFGIEETGRYGKIGARNQGSIDVKCVEINEVLREVLEREGAIDILKIDTEGHELRTLRAIDEGHLGRIGRIYLEAQPEAELLPSIFEQRKHYSVCHLITRAESGR